MLLLIGWVQFSARGQSDFPKIFNTQNTNDVLSSAADALKGIRVPPGFNVTLFASEPDVQQPISLATDARGRLWVAENYTYAESAVNFDLRLRDRIVILEDTNHDGHFDKRTVFWDKGQHLTSVLPGFGGVWVLCAPQLLFIPDRNGDDIPDGEPEVVLDGWNAGPVRHNIVNGLSWGPDGWIYGRHGIMADSLVGKPSTPTSERVKLNCAIWRYHPTRKIFEVVAQGTTNPWGMDFDDHGQFFFINTVIGHLFHLIPGAHYKRMYGEDLTPHTYELIDQHADHYHWDTGQNWTDSRGAKGEHGRLGGGHAHCGMIFYLGDNWPDSYRNTLLTVNLHGRRLNNDIPLRSGSGYSAKHGADLFFAEDAWFRGVELTGGPDGGVYVADWSDYGECHENDGVHRTSGRIYKMTYGTPKPSPIDNIAALPDRELAKLQLHKNDWFVRQSRLALQERAAAGRDLSEARAELLQMFEQQTDVTRKLRAMWALNVAGGIDQQWLLNRLNDPSEHIRVWAIRLLPDFVAPSDAVLKRLTEMAEKDPSGLVRLFLASTLQKIPPSRRGSLAKALLSHGEDSFDHNLPLMLWYGVEPIATGEPFEAIKLAEASQIPLVRQFIARRLAEEIERTMEPVNAMVQMAATNSPGVQLDILTGFSEALRGWKTAPIPSAWPELRLAVQKQSDPQLKNRFLDLSVLFRDESTIEQLRHLAISGHVDMPSRKFALQTLIDHKTGNLGIVMKRVLNNQVLAPIAIRGLAAENDPDLTRLLLERYGEFDSPARLEAINALVARPASAEAVLDAIAAGKIKRTDMTAFHARQINSLKNPPLDKKLADIWGEMRTTPDDKKQAIAHYKTWLTSARVSAANPSRGRALFNTSCGLCHTLYGEGAKIGPDLTGSGRSNLDYLLENVVDPSAMVGADFRMSLISMKDGRVLNGIISSKTDRTITLQTLTEKVALERSDTEKIEDSKVSLMPEGLFDGMQETQIADLISYLMTQEQVPLPSARNN